MFEKLYLVRRASRNRACKYVSSLQFIDVFIENLKGILNKGIAPLCNRIGHIIERREVPQNYAEKLRALLDNLETYAKYLKLLIEYHEELRKGGCGHG